MDLNQPFVHCSRCNLPYDRNVVFSLTSCAHILCEKHIPGSGKPMRCPVCQKDNISVLKLSSDPHVNSKFPAEVQNFFIPFTRHLEPLYSIAQFQWDALSEQCEYYKSISYKLQEKCNRQRQLLYNAREELEQLSELKERVKQLEGMHEVSPCGHSRQQQRIVQRGPAAVPNRPETIDLTDSEQVSFISKLKDNNRLRNKNMSSTSIIAESTSLQPFTPESQHRIQRTIAKARNGLFTPTKFQALTPSSKSCSDSSNINEDTATTTMPPVFDAPRSNHMTDSLPPAIERLKLKRSNTSTVSSRGIFSNMRIGFSATSLASPSSKSSSKFRRVR
ncbi:SUMO ligase CST9 Ecym_3263 [Eremothecium cymbalariae DBVPG|uniref:RING-type domain-containing protein n=1 Tax=Eremothecium cymbalariae (strain CBS 270.75 / DBVPG 7215 / KCTC 17166 / NRRL Y-17582) TaxID=931890 RepID=G8JRI7_ERECY|nr:Hypothetical protein Ecym_3263 [Eremothecium cymbalariae DBVPG\